MEWVGDDAYYESNLIYILIKRCFINVNVKCFSNKNGQCTLFNTKYFGNANCIYQHYIQLCCSGTTETNKLKYDKPIYIITRVHVHVIGVKWKLSKRVN